MKRSKLLLYLILLLFLFGGNYFAQSMDQLPADNDVNVLIILPNGYGPNYFLIRDTFESFGWNVTTTSKTSSVSICHLFTALHNGNVDADASLTSLNANDFDAVFLVSSEQYISNPMGDILSSPTALTLLGDFNTQNKAVSTFCQGIHAFANTQLINSRTVTGAAGYSSECTNAGATFLQAQDAPIRDGNVVTTTRGRTNCVRFPEQIEKVIQGN